MAKIKKVRGERIYRKESFLPCRKRNGIPFQVGLCTGGKYLVHGPQVCLGLRAAGTG